MKKLFLIVLAAFLIGNVNAQLFSFGVKGGINSSKISFSDFSIEKPPKIIINPDSYQTIAGIIADETLNDEQRAQQLANPDFYSLTSPKVSFEPSSYEMGYHFGAFARVKVAMIFIQPELIFSQTNASININPDGFDPDEVSKQITSSKIKYTNFDVPVLLGFKIGPAHLCAGPVATFKLNSDIDDETKKFLEEINGEEDMDVFTVTKNATFGAQIGTGLTIAKKVTIDLRYEFGLSKLGESVTIGEQEFKTDQRQNQFIGSIGWMF